MIEKNSLVSVPSKALAPGDLVIGSPYEQIVGLVVGDEEFTYMVALSSEDEKGLFSPRAINKDSDFAFLVLRDWRVNIGTSKYSSKYTGDFSLGDIVLKDDNFFIATRANSATYLYGFSGKLGNNTAGDYFFSDWTIVTGEGDDKVEIFARHKTGI